MKKFRFYCGAMLLALGAMMSACSDSDQAGPGVPSAPDGADKGEKVYINVAINVPKPNGGRSVTKPEGGSDGGIEEGTKVENTVSNIMILLVGHDQSGKDNCFIAKWTHSYSNPLSIEGNGQIVTAEFNRSALTNHYDAHSSASWANNISVYVICNYNSDIADNIPNAGVGSSIAWLDNVLTPTLDDRDDLPFWKDNHFLMTNATSYSAQIPSKAEIESNRYGTVNDAYNLTSMNGAIPVERAMARFDYAAKIEGSEVKADTNGNLYYKLADAQDEDAAAGISAQPEIRISLHRMALVNMSKKFYLFRRVSADGTPTDAVIGGTEVGLPSCNYVVDPEWEFKKNPQSSESEYISRFHYWCKDFAISTSGAIQNAKWAGVNIADVVTANPESDKYYSWRYVVPNTIPGDANNQKVGVTTGVVFKAKIEAADQNIGVGARMRDQYDIFAFQGKLYGSWSDVRAYAMAKPESDLAIAFKNAVALDPTLDYVPTEENPEPAADWCKTLSDDQTNIVVKGETTGFAKYAYVANGGDGAGAGYFCYYYYWNRHNDNMLPAQMGPMEFAVVRNNVYKLAVTKINRLGHPFRPGNDPDPVDPDDPDEEANLYMTLSVKVLPWTVRYNNIEF